MLEHMQVHVLSKRPPCPSCTSVAPTLQDLYQHFNEDHPNILSRLQCNICKEVFLMPSTFKRHLTICHPPYIITTDNNQVFSPTFGTISNDGTVTIETTSQNVQCPHCLEVRTFKNKTTLENHIRIHDDITVQKLKCEQCSKEFVHRSTLRHHFQQVHLGIRYGCLHCSKTFTAKSNLKVHLKLHSGVGPAFLMCCGYCTNSFQTTSELLGHLKVAHNKKLPAGLDYMTNQSQEIPSTSQPGSMASTSSLSSSSSSSNLPNTSLLSTSSKFQSDINVNGTRCACGIELVTESALISHLHSEVEAHGQYFECTRCDGIFNHPCNLTSHVRQKHDVNYQDYPQRRYGCSCCEEMFENYEDLERHTVSEHQMDQDHVPLNDPLGDDFNFSMEGIEVNKNTFTFHVGPGIIGDGMSFTSVEPTVITLD